MKIELEVSEETLEVVNGVLKSVVTNSNLDDEQKQLLERFRLDLIKPFVVNSDHPITEAFLKYFGMKLEII